MKLQDLYDRDLAILQYNITEDRQTFRFRDELIDMRPGNVKTHLVDGIQVANIEDVRKAHEIRT